MEKDAPIMRIAIVGGGMGCIHLMDLMRRHKFEEIQPEIVAVADLKPDAPGMVRARRDGLFVTCDYNDFFEREDINLIVELTGNQDIYNDILTKKKKTVRAIAHTTALLFWEISRVSGIQKATSLELEKTRKMYEVIINELIQEDVMTIGADYRVLDINETLLRHLGLEREKALGRFCYQLTHRQDTPCSGEQHPCPLKTTLKTRKSTQTTHIHIDGEGQERFYAISCYPLLEKGDVVGIIEISKDITHDINLQKALLRQEKMVSIGRLSAGVAHEVNNPLTTILTTARLVQEETPPEDPLYKDLETICRETIRCRNIVQSLLNFSRQTRPEKTLSDLNEVVTESFTLTRKQAAFQQVELATDLAENLPYINIDMDQIKQTLINLVLNAVEATPPGGKIVLCTRPTQDPQILEITVSDTGSGIAPEHLPKIFEPFFTTKETGTGLGLAITHGIIAQHGGTIHADSAPDRGTRFIIRLPLNNC